MDFVLGTRHALRLSWLQPSQPLLKSRFPHLTFHLYLGSGEGLSLRMTRHEVDCAVSSRRITEPNIEGKGRPTGTDPSRSGSQPRLVPIHLSGGRSPVGSVSSHGHRVDRIGLNIRSFNTILTSMYRFTALSLAVL
jgi:hypothetical protein